MDKTVDDLTATEVTTPDEPAAGGDGKGDESDKVAQGGPEAPEESGVEGGKKGAEGVAPMEEEEPEGETEPETVEATTSVARQVDTWFILAELRTKPTSQQKGQYVKHAVQDELKGKHLTSEPLAQSVVGGEERVKTVMRGMKDDQSKEVAEALKLGRYGIITTNGDFAGMGAGFVVPKDFPVNGLVRHMNLIMPAEDYVYMAEIGEYYKMGGGDTDTKGKIIVGTRHS